MIRLSIRDMLWLMLVVALGLGWLVNARQLLAKVSQTKIDCEAAYVSHIKRGHVWRMRAGALEHALTERGCKVTWHPEVGMVRLEWPGRGMYTDSNDYHIPTDLFPPSIDD